MKPCRVWLLAAEGCCVVSEFLTHAHHRKVASGATLVFMAALALLGAYAFRKKLLPGESCWGFLKEGKREVTEMVRLLSSEDRYCNPNSA